MSDLVIIPTFDRPEFLWLCLEYIHNIFGGSKNIPHIWVCEDIRADKPKSFTIEMEMLAVHRFWQDRLGYNYYATKPHTTYGNSYNVLNALQTASGSAYRYVYLIEDDVLVTPDFFRWNEAVQEAFKPWASCAGRLNRSLNFHMNGPEAIDENIKDVNACHVSMKAYNSWATCFSKEAMRVIASAASGYEHFRPGFEQDIMIQEHIRRAQCKTIWPYVPRAYHMGWYSYHRDGGMMLYGTLEEKVKALRVAVKSPTKLKALAGPQDMDVYPTTTTGDMMEKVYLR